MKVLNKEEKEIYESLKIPFEFIDCINLQVPEGWKKIKIAKFEDDKSMDSFDDMIKKNGL